MKTLIFHGSLRTLCPENIKVEASTVAEAISALKLHPQFNPRGGVKHTVSIQGFGSVDALYEKTKVEEIHIHPVMTGAGKPGWAQIIIGAILIVASSGIASAFVAAGFTGVTAGSVAFAGAMMALGGILQVVAPQPSSTTTTNQNRYLGAGANTVAIGTRIPLVYGRRKVGGQYISFDIQANDLNSTPDSWYASSFTNYDPTQTGTVPPTGTVGDVEDSPSTHYNNGLGPQEDTP